MDDDQGRGASDQGRPGAGASDLPEMQAQASCEDAVIEPGRCVPATPEDAATIRRIAAAVKADPEKYAFYAWIDPLDTPETQPELPP